MVGEHEMLTGIIQRMKNFCDTKDLQIKRNHKETSEGRRPHCIVSDMDQVFFL